MSEESRSVETRVEQLEKRNRLQRWFLLGVPALCLLLGASANDVLDWRGKSLTAEKLVLVDGEGKERGSFAAGAGGSQLILRDTEGRIRVRTIADYEGKGPAFFLVNEKDKVAATVRMIDNGPILVLCNDEGKNLVAVGKSTGNGVGYIEFYDDKGNPKGGYGGTALK